MPSNPAGSPAVRQMLEAVNASRPWATPITATQYRSARSVKMQVNGQEIRIAFVPNIRGAERPSQEVIDHCAAVLPTRVWWAHKEARDPRLMLLFLHLVGYRLLPEFRRMIVPQVLDYLETKAAPPLAVADGTREEFAAWLDGHIKWLRQDLTGNADTRNQKLRRELLAIRLGQRAVDSASDPESGTVSSSAEKAEAIEDFLESVKALIERNWAPESVVASNFQADENGKQLSLADQERRYGDAYSFTFMAQVLNPTIAQSIIGDPGLAPVDNDERRLQVGEFLQQATPNYRRLRAILRGLADADMELPSGAMDLCRQLCLAHKVVSIDERGLMVAPGDDAKLYSNIMLALNLLPDMKDRPNGRVA